MYAADRSDRKPWTVPMLAEAKRDGRRLVMLTAYDAGFARTLDDNGVDIILVGDSLGMVVQGHGSTLPVSIDDIAYHTTCVARGVSNALLVADLPFQSDATTARALDASMRCLQSGAAMVKLEGAGFKLDIIRFLVEREIPVCAHLGLTPQSVLRLGGYKVQGRDDRAARARVRAFTIGGRHHRVDRRPDHRHRRRSALRRPGAGAARPARARQRSSPSKVRQGFPRRRRLRRRRRARVCAGRARRQLSRRRPQLRMKPTRSGGGRHCAP